MEDFQKLFDSFATLKVGVIGDVMLDTYMWGSVDRISPEAPVPVVTLSKKEYRVGGAANVALNCKSLGAQVAILSVTGDDTEGLLLTEMLDARAIDTSWLIKDATRITTSKTRVISRNQQMMRLDAEITRELDKEAENYLMTSIEKFITTTDPHVLIFQDYNKGVLTELVISKTIDICRQAGIITAVDPKQMHFFSYKQADIFKPNFKEVKDGLNLQTEQSGLEQLKQVHLELTNKLNHQISLITLSEKGVFFAGNNRAGIIPSHLRNISDVSGAGDTVIAVAALVYTATKNVHLMSEIANIAGGLVCEEVGTVAIDREKLLHECELLLS